MSTETHTVADDILIVAREAYHSAFNEYGNAKDQDIFAAIAKAINDAVMAERERDQWQPIETAPKDWTDVLLYLPDEDDGSGARGVVKGWFSMADGGFDCWMSYESNSGQCYPTKWMPLPSAPKAKG